MTAEVTVKISVFFKRFSKAKRSALENEVKGSSTSEVGGEDVWLLLSVFPQQNNLYWKTS